MALYFKDTEITNIDNLVPQSGLDITNIWFGSTNVYTVWATYEGTLPATLNANGADMRQYQIYGNTGGVGSRTVNLFDLSTVVIGKYIDSNGNEQTSIADPNWGVRLHHSYYFPVEAEQEYVFFSTCGARLYPTTVAFCWYDADKNFLSRTTTELPVDTSATEYSFNGAAPQTARFAIVNFVTNRYANVMITPGTTPPEAHVPNGYKLDMGASSSNVMPSAPAETKTSNGITVTCDGEGRYSISGTATANTYITFDIPEFTIPISAKKGGNGTFSMFNTSSNPNVSLQFLYNDATVDEWVLNPTNRISTTYVTMGGRTVNGLKFFAPSSNTFVGTMSPMFTNNGVLPNKYQPYSNTVTPIYIGSDPLEKDEYVDYQAQKVYRMINGVLTPTDPPVPLPALPTCEGTTIVDYAGSETVPEKVLLKYRKEGY